MSEPAASGSDSARGGGAPPLAFAPHAALAGENGVA